MKTFIRSLLVTILSILLLTWLLPEVNVVNTVTLLIAGIVLSLLNVLVKPFLKILFLPINIVTLGLFSWVINVLILYTVLWLVPGFSIQEISLLGIEFNQFWSVTIVALILSLFGSFLSGIL